MCGICGAWVHENAPLLEEEQILAMREAMIHRGPDDGEHWISEDRRVALGSRRLAIIDLSPSGRMPIWNEDRTIAIVFNGECYNFKELRKWLIEKGHRFRSQTDTECVLHLYEESKTPEEMLGRLRGMYAFAIWDGVRQRLLLARDRLGIKPLYFSRQPKGIFFASEVRSLLASGFVSSELDPVGIQGYFALGASPLPYTPLAQVRALPAGHYLLLEDGNGVVRPYWTLQFHEDNSLREEEWLEQIQAALLDSVRRHLVADVPVGIFSSGGIDSSVLVALARHINHQCLRTYSVVFSEADYSEAEFARRLAARYETEHHEFLVSAADILTRLEKAIAALDLPSWDGMNVYLVSQMTREQGTIVALSGLGGDELFFGYPSFQWVPRLSRSSRWCSAIPGAGAVLALAARHASPGSRAARLPDLASGRDPRATAYYVYRGLLDQHSLRNLLRPKFADGNNFDPIEYLAGLIQPEPAQSGNAVSALELKGWMHYQLLRDSDAMSMAHSLELRVPFLDHELVELLARVPAALKQPRRGMPKPLLLKALPSPLPTELWNRPKRGFTLPFDTWLRKELRSTAEEALLSHNSPLRSICRPEILKEIWDGFLRGRVRWTRVWTAVVLMYWLDGVRNYAREIPQDCQVGMPRTRRT